MLIAESHYFGINLSNTALVQFPFRTQWLNSWFFKQSRLKTYCQTFSDPI